MVRMGEESGISSSAAEIGTVVDAIETDRLKLTVHGYEICAQGLDALARKRERDERRAKRAADMLLADPTGRALAYEQQQLAIVRAVVDVALGMYGSYKLKQGMRQLPPA